MATLAYENFSAESALSAAWTVQTAGFSFSSGLGVYASGAVNVRPYANYSGSWPNDQWVQCMVGQVGTTTNPESAIGLAVRCSAGANFYAFYRDNADGKAYLFKVVAGVVSYTDLGALTLTVGNILRLEVATSTLSAFKNGVLVGTYNTLGSLSSGAPGIQGINHQANPAAANSQIFSNWSAGSLPYVAPGAGLLLGVG